MDKIREKEIEFLKESNAVEGVYDNLSLMQATFAWDWLKRQKKMNAHVILKTHKIIMLHQLLAPNEKGYFRRVPVWVGGSEGIDMVQVPGAIDHWAANVEDLRKNAKNEPDVFKERLTKEHHVIYEKIHPFVDGNGRTGRMFLNWERLELKLPILVIKASESQEYYKWFR